MSSAIRAQNLVSVSEQFCFEKKFAAAKTFKEAPFHLIIPTNSLNGKMTGTPLFVL